jgi:hypothetical protein
VLDLIGAILYYLYFVILDGDWLNDWLTHMPPTVRAIMEHIGKIIDAILDP